MTPYFELNGQRFEIKKTRYILAEYDKLQQESDLSIEDKENAVKAQSLLGDIQRYAEKTQELWENFTETYDDEDERKYKKAKSLYDNALRELAKLEAETGSTARLQKKGIDILEKIAIKSIAEQYFNMDESKAEVVWKNFVEKIGNDQTIEWLNYMAECLFNEEKEEDDFLSQMRKKAQQKAENRKNGLKRIK